MFGGISDDGAMTSQATIRGTVRRLLDHADAIGVDQWSPEALVPVVEALRGRPLHLDLHARLPSGVSAVWHGFVDDDSIAIARGWPTRDRSIAHEFGHMLLGHGASAQSVASSSLGNVGSGGLTLLFTRRCVGVRRNRQEIAAEDFAALLCHELQRRDGYPQPWRASVLADAFG